MERVTLAIDIGGTKTAAGLVSDKGQILLSSRRPVVQGSARMLAESLQEQCRCLLQDASVKPASVGIGVKGLVNDRENRLVSSSILGGPQHDDLRKILEDSLGLPCAIDNDVNAATLAEAAWGAGREHDTFVYVNVGTGTAIGIYDRGRLVRGAVNTCGEIGEMLISLPGESRLFFLENVASGKGLSDEAYRLASGYPSSVLQTAMKESSRICASEIFAAARNRDPLACRVIQHACLALTVAMIQLEAVTGAGLYVFGGGVISDPLIFDSILGSVPDMCKKYSLPFTFRMRISALGAADAGLLGAAMLGFSC